MIKSLLIVSLLPIMALGGFLWVEWRLSDWSLPPLARGTLAIHPSPFSSRIITRFPVGSSESALAAELRKEGFHIDLYKRRCETAHPRLSRSECYSAARLDRMTSPLTSVGWQVVWIAKEGVITEISAVTGSDGP
jgi:hypothetical protein